MYSMSSKKNTEIFKDFLQKFNEKFQKIENFVQILNIFFKTILKLILKKSLQNFFYECTKISFNSTKITKSIKLISI